MIQYRNESPRGSEFIDKIFDPVFGYRVLRRLEGDRRQRVHSASRTAGHYSACFDTMSNVNVRMAALPGISFAVAVIAVPASEGISDLVV